MKVIKYNGASYPAKEIELDNGMTVLVSVKCLQDALLDSDNNYKDTEAKFIDDKIYYYLTSDEFMLSNKNIKNLIL